MAVIARSRGVRVMVPVVMMVLPHGNDFLVVVVLVSRRGGAETHLVCCMVVPLSGRFWGLYLQRSIRELYVGRIRDPSFGSEVADGIKIRL